MQVLVVDNYDSFVFNLVQYLGQLGVNATVWRNDDERLADPAAVARDFDGILLSPGPDTRSAPVPPSRWCTPAPRAAPRCSGVPGPPGHRGGLRCDRGPRTRAAARQDQHRAPCERRCAARSSGSVHGHPVPLADDPAETLPPVLEATGHTDSGVIMAVRHTELPIHGVQFHPESILTQGGHRMLANWLGFCGAAPAEGLVARLEQEVADAVARATARA
jgi:anthranilate synthase component 2/para-aminobenzoate synthetase component 2